MGLFKKKEHVKVKIVDNYRYSPMWYNKGEEHEVVENDFCFVLAKDENKPIGTRRTIRKDHAQRVK